MPVLESLLGNENVGKTRKQHFTKNLARHFAGLKLNFAAKLKNA
jgi:hypothetical protein